MGETVSIDLIQFRPLGAHQDGLAINTAKDLFADATPTYASFTGFKPTKIMLQVHTQNARYRLDGTAPTTSAGFQLKAGDPPIILSIVGITSLKVIEEAASADLQMQWGF